MYAVAAAGKINSDNLLSCHETSVRVSTARVPRERKPTYCWCNVFVSFLLSRTVLPWYGCTVNTWLSLLIQKAHSLLRGHHFHNQFVLYDVQAWLPAATHERSPRSERKMKRGRPEITHLQLSIAIGVSFLICLCYLFYLFLWDFFDLSIHSSPRRSSPRHSSPRHSSLSHSSTSHSRPSYSIPGLTRPSHSSPTFCRQSLLRPSRSSRSQQVTIV